VEDRRTPAVFSRPNSQHLADQLDLVENAHSDAVNETPPSSQESIQGTEGAVIGLIRRMRREAVDQARGLLLSLSDQRQKIDPTTVKRQLQSTPGDCEIEIDRLNAKHSATLASLTGMVNSQKKDYDLFRSKNGLHRIARYPDSQILHYSIIAVIVILETLANAYFFQRGSELGYLGGIQQAFIFSIINVLFAILVGDNVFRLTNHKEFSQRVIGWTTFCAYLLFLVLFNLLIGHFRAAIQQTVIQEIDPIQAVFMAYQTFVENPLAVADVEAWVLVIMGIMIGLFAFVKAYKADDPYPRYGDVQRDYFERRKKLESTVAKMQKSVTKTIDIAMARVRTLPNDLKSEHRKLMGPLRDAASVPGRLTSHLDDLQDVCNQLLRQYRAENQKIRQTKAPDYFSNSYAFEDNLDLGNISIESEEKYAEKLGKEIDELDPDIDSIKQKLKELNRTALEKVALYATEL